MEIFPGHTDDVIVLVYSEKNIYNIVIGRQTLILGLKSVIVINEQDSKTPIR